MHKQSGIKAVLYFSVLVLMGCGERSSNDHTTISGPADASGHSAPTRSTVARNTELARLLPLDNQQDFEDARRGLIASPENLIVNNAQGKPVWDMPSYRFVQGDAPGSVNPSLWRQAVLNNIHGLFEVVPGIYQIRGFDLANMTLIEGQRGWIIVDPLTSRETAGAAFQFAMQHLEPKPVSAILFTHSHIDHFGGVEGVLEQMSEQDRAKLRIIAPKGFIEEATSENLIAGPAMSRRSMFMYGKRLARSERGHIGSGLGKGPAFGSFGIAEPTELVDLTPSTLEIDGQEFVFQYAPDSEAPAEFTFYLPAFQAFCGAEVVSHNLHNLYTLRGAKVRDALAWSRYIDEAMKLFADAKVYFGSHHWPVWGESRVGDFLEKQRDVYKYIHDQSVRLMNAGFTPEEIAEELVFPEELSSNFATRGYYGSLKHNAKAIYQFYMGWYNGNPAMLDPLPGEQTAQRTIQMMGGATKVLARAKELYAQASGQDPEKGYEEYRWLAHLLNMLVYSEPEQDEAKELLARVYDQLGYMSESAPWRDVYLSAAFELRHGGPEEGISPSVMREVFLHAPVEKFFESMAVNLNGPEASGKELSIEVEFTDLKSRYLLSLKNSVLRHRLLQQDEQAETNARLQLTHPLFIDILVGNAGLKEMLFSDLLEVDGSELDLIRFLSLIDKQSGTFNIVEP